jgi:hypothetical protein
MIAAASASCCRCWLAQHSATAASAARAALPLSSSGIYIQGIRHVPTYRHRSKITRCQFTKFDVIAMDAYVLANTQTRKQNTDIMFIESCRRRVRHILTQPFQGKDTSLPPLHLYTYVPTPSRLSLLGLPPSHGLLYFVQGKQSRKATPTSVNPLICVTSYT